MSWDYKNKIDFFNRDNELKDCPRFVVYVVLNVSFELSVTSL